MALGPLNREAATLVERVDALRRRAAAFGAVRGLLIGGGLGGLVALAAGVGPGLLCGALGLGVGLGLAPRRAALVSRLDAAGGLGEAVACALDHGRRHEPIILAQARAARIRADVVPPEDVVPRPSALYLAGPLTWLAVITLSAPSPSEMNGDRASAEARSGAPRLLAGASVAPSAGASGRGTDVRPSGEGLEPAARPKGDLPSGVGLPSAQPRGEGDGSDGEPGKAAGTGAQAGELSAGRAPVVAAEGPEGGVVRSLAIDRGTGTLTPGTGDAATLGQAPAPRDDLLGDPARPFAPRDAGLISAYFDRRRARRPAASPKGQPAPPSN